VRIAIRPRGLESLLLLGTGALYVVGLDRNGWGNSFYAAAVQAGSRSWTAMFFGSSDAANSITVDKPPASLWVMEVSARLFGFSSWSVLVPQALMGVAAVALLAATVRRVLGPWAGLLAGLLLALTPVATLMFRYDNPDALMTLLVVAAAYTTTRAVEDGRTRWAVLTGGLLGLAFLTKSLQAFLVLPGLAACVLVAGPGSLRRRLTQLVAAGAALAVAGGWWFLAVSLVPRTDRPWVGGTVSDSALELALGYNGLGRLVGEKSPSGRVTVSGGSIWRLFGSAGDQVGWLLPAAVLALAAAVLLVRHAGRTDPIRAAVVMWGGWAAVTALVLSVMQGIWHAYYTVELAPALAALVAIGATLLWRRDTRRARAVLAAGSLVTTVWAVALAARRLGPVNGVSVAVAVVGVAAVAAVVTLAVRGPQRRLVAGLLVATAVLGPATWSWATVVRPHTGSSVAAGPIGGSLVPLAASHRRPALPRAGLVLLRDDADDWTWTAAVVGRRADDLQLAAGAPVMPVGGFAGIDPSPTLAQFRSDVAAHRVHWFVAGPTSRSGPAAAITAWVRTHGRVVHVGTTTLYDLSRLSSVRVEDRG
jgi:4-amino-4-deoxy-L-arabinose transferase-like glycosyltransferase